MKSRIFPNCHLIGEEPKYCYTGKKESEYITIQGGQFESFAYTIGYLVNLNYYFVEWYYHSSISWTSLVKEEKRIVFVKLHTDPFSFYGSEIIGHKILFRFLDMYPSWSLVFDFEDKNIRVKFRQSVGNPHLYRIYYADSAWVNDSWFYTSTESCELQRLQDILTTRQIPSGISQAVFDGFHVPKYLQFTESLAMLLFLNWID